MRVVLHIGTEKTGTTTLQRALDLNRQQLSKRGFHVVESAGRVNHRWVPSSCMSDDRSDKFFMQQHAANPGDRRAKTMAFREAFHDELSSLPPQIHTVLISSEHLHSRLVRQSEVDAVGEMLSPFSRDIRVVCYLRRQVDMCTSLYSTALKGGATVNFDEFLTRCRPENIYYDYEAILGMWANQFGRESLHVRLFDRSELVNSDIIDDFFHQLDSELLMILARPVANSNESITPGGQAIALAANRVLHSGESAFGPVRQRLLVDLTRQLPGRGQQPNPKRWLEIQESFTDVNESVRQEYFPDRTELFSLEPPTKQDVDLQEPFIDGLTTAFERVLRAGQESDLPDHFAPMLRDFAISLEASDPQTALAAMELAAKIRPRGARIQKKVEEYRRKHSHAENRDSS